jgi:hypothetical protein
MDIIKIVRKMRNFDIIIKNIVNYTEIKKKIESNKQNFINLDTSDLDIMSNENKSEIKSDFDAYS